MRVSRRSFLRVGSAGAIAISAGGLPRAFANQADLPADEFDDAALRARGVAIAESTANPNVLDAVKRGCFADVFSVASSRPVDRQRQFLDEFYKIFPAADEMSKLVVEFANLQWTNPSRRGDATALLDGYYRALSRDPMPMRLIESTAAAPVFTIPVRELSTRCTAVAVASNRRSLLMASALSGSGAIERAASELRGYVSWPLDVVDGLANQLRVLASTAFAWLNLRDALPPNPLLPLLLLCSYGLVPCGEQEDGFTCVDLAHTARV